MSLNFARLFSFVSVITMCTGLSILGAEKSAATQVGTAVIYSDNMDGKLVAMKGEKYDKNALTAATHSRYRMGSTLRVTNLSNNKSVEVKVNDRMNPKSKAAVDLSLKAAQEIDMVKSGRTKVKIELVRAKE